MKGRIRYHLKAWALAALYLFITYGLMVLAFQFWYWWGTG